MLKEVPFKYYHPLGCVILSETISHPTGERKPQAKARGYRVLSKESLNLGPWGIDIDKSLSMLSY